MQSSLVTNKNVVKGPMPEPTPGTATPPTRERQAQLLEMRPVLLRFLVLKLHNRADAEDALQTICVNFMRKQASHAITNVGAYLYRMAMNEVRQHYRRRGCNPVTFDTGVFEVASEKFDSTTAAQYNEDPTPDGTDTAAQAMDDLERLQQIFARIPPQYEKYKQALTMTVLRKLPKEVVAKKLGITKKSVDTYVGRGLAYCRQVVQADE